MDDYKYVGWVPCVNGHLDFGLMRVGIRGGFTDKNFKDGSFVEKNLSASGVQASHDRLIILQSKVDWRDSNVEDDDIGRFRIIVCAKVASSNDLDARFLEGDVLIYPLEAEPECLEDKKNINVHALSHDIDDNDAFNKYLELSNVVSNVNNLRGLKNDTLRCSIHFEIEPCGIVKLKYNTNTCALDEKSDYLVARQVFYYLKYSLHSHRHHVDEQDSLTTITPIDIDAGLRLVGQLKRELTSLSREQKIDNRFHATSNPEGIISYTKSLIMGLRDGGWISNEIYGRELAYLNNVSESFSSLERNIERSSSILELNKSKSKVLLGFVLISCWGVFNFLLESSSKIKIDAPESYLIPMFLIVIAVISYAAFKEYYRVTSDPVSLVSVYNIELSSVIIRLFLALIGIAALILLLP